MKRYLLVLGLLIGGSALTSCESFLDVNENPNNPSETTPNFLLPSIISNDIQTQMFTALRTPYIEQYVVSRTVNSGGNDQFRFTNAQSTNTFNYSYHQSGGNIRPMIQDAEAEGSAYYVGAGKIMQALILAHATDMLGDLPYSEAYQPANIKPKYDSQEQIYATVNQLLDEGIMEMSKAPSENTRPFYTNAPSESGDILYKGDQNKWIRLAYSLKARQLQHLTKKMGRYDPNAVLALVANGFKNTLDDAQIQFQTAVSPLANTTNIFGTTRANFGLASYSLNFIRYLNGTTFPGVTDPRFGIMAPTTSTGAAPGAGVPTGANVIPNTNNVTDFYASWYARDLGYYEVITYHELKFIEAEAAFRAGNRSRALEAYREGIRAHMRKIGVGGAFSAPTITFPVITEAQITAYLNSVAVAQNEAELTLRHIMEQKYIAMFLNPESWSDMRRYDFSTDIYVNLQYPTGSGINLTLANNMDPTRRFPRRLLPGATEVQNNPDAIAKLFADAGATTNDDYISKPLWWDMP